MILWLPFVILAACVVIPILLERRVEDARRVYRIAFSVVCVMFLALVVGGIHILRTDLSMTGLAGAFLLLGAVLSIPFMLWLGWKSFRKQTAVQVSSASDQSEESTHDRMTRTSIGLSENVTGLLCYLLLWVSGVVMLWKERESRTVRFHAIQSTVFFGGITILWFATLRHGTDFPSTLQAAVSILALLLCSAAGLSWVLLMTKAYRGERYKLPWIGNLAEKYAGPLDSGHRAPEQEERVVADSTNEDESTMNRRVRVIVLSVVAVACVVAALIVVMERRPLFPVGPRSAP